MKKIKYITCASVLLSFGFPVFADTILDNATSYNGNLINLTSGDPFGNQITFGPNQVMTDFSFEYYSPGVLTSDTTLGVEVNFYLNDGPLAGGYSSPGTMIYSSGWYFNSTGTELTQGAHNLIYDNTDLSTMVTGLPSNELPSAQDVTVTITFTNLGSAVVDLLAANNVSTPQATDYGTYWVYNSGTSSWALLTNSVAANFVSQIQGTTVPEPSMAGLGVLGGVLFAAAGILRRKV